MFESQEACARLAGLGMECVWTCVTFFADDETVLCCGVVVVGMGWDASGMCAAETRHARAVTKIPDSFAQQLRDLSGSLLFPLPSLIPPIIQ
jgi:hypothetical protein